MGRIQQFFRELSSVLGGIRGNWRLEGWDAFSGDSYSIPGRWRTKKKAVAAARRRLRKLERTQPREISGGQDGIQDQVFVRGPDGESLRVVLAVSRDETMYATGSYDGTIRVWKREHVPSKDSH